MTEWSTAVTPEEHYARGLELLAAAERVMDRPENWEYANTRAAVAQAHFSAAASGLGIRAMTQMPPPAPAAYEPDRGQDWLGILANLRSKYGRKRD